MKHDGSFTIRCDGGMDDLIMPHAMGATVMASLDRRQRTPASTPCGAALVIPMAVLIRRLIELPVDMQDHQLKKHVELARLDRIRQVRSTSATIAMGDLDVTGDTGVVRPCDAGPAKMHDASDDPVMAALMRRHGVEAIARTMPGIDAFWGGMEAFGASFGGPNPYVRYHGLPDGFHPFLLRPACPGHESCVAVRLGRDGVDPLYCSQGGYAWIGISQQLPQTVIDHLPGRPATDLVGDEALEGYVIAGEQTQGDNMFTLEWRP